MLFKNPALRIFAATMLFAGVHSAFASQRMKRTAMLLTGERNRNGLYRLFYIGQSFASFGALVYFIRRQPGRVLYEVRGHQRVPLRAAQVACLGIATAAARQVGLRRITGIESFTEWWSQQEVHAEPEAQGPASEGPRMRIAGPFCWSRHPLNFWPMPVLWLNPRMTSNLLAFNIAATVYLVIGSYHEEARLLREHGDKYMSYQRSDVPFYFPSMSRLRYVYRADRLR